MPFRNRPYSTPIQHGPRFTSRTDRIEAMTLGRSVSLMRDGIGRASRYADGYLSTTDPTLFVATLSARPQWTYSKASIEADTLGSDNYSLPASKICQPVDMRDLGSHDSVFSRHSPWLLSKTAPCHRPAITYLNSTTLKVELVEKPRLRQRNHVQNSAAKTPRPGPDLRSHVKNAKKHILSVRFESRIVIRHQPPQCMLI